MGTEPQQALQRAVRGLLDSGKYSDFTIKCGADEYKVHKAIVCPRSRFFDAVFTHDMQENRTDTVDLKDDDPKAVWSMVHYLYNLNYSVRHSEENDHATSELSSIWGAGNQDGDSADVERRARKVPLEEMPPEPPLEIPLEPEDDDWEIKEGKHNLGKPTKSASRRLKIKKGSSLRHLKTRDTETLVHHCRVYALAEKYDIQSLKSIASKKFKLECETHWDCIGFIDAIREVYSNTPDHDRGLRDVVVETIRAHQELLDMGQVKSVLKETLLAFDIVMASRQYPQDFPFIFD